MWPGGLVPLLGLDMRVGVSAGDRPGQNSIFFKQLLWGLGCSLQQLLMPGGSPGGATLIATKTPGFKEVLTNAPVLDRMLGCYIESCKAKAK